MTDRSDRDYSENEKSELSRKVFYESLMKEKGFEFIENGPCDDAIEGTIHKQSIAYIESKIVTESNTIIDFKFKDACCQEFLGDYSILNDTLVFQFEQVNDEVCSCLCWYKYKLTINEPKLKFSTIEIKKRLVNTVKL